MPRHAERCEERGDEGAGGRRRWRDGEREKERVRVIEGYSGQGGAKKREGNEEDELASIPACAIGESPSADR